MRSPISVHVEAGMISGNASDKSGERYLYAGRILGESWINLVKDWNIDKGIMIGNSIELALLIAEIFNDLQIPYFIGGSVASSLWGESRTTLDIEGW